VLHEMSKHSLTWQLIHHGTEDGNCAHSAK
jgi:hypothetical protein